MAIFSKCPRHLRRPYVHEGTRTHYVPTITRFFLRRATMMARAIRKQRASKKGLRPHCRGTALVAFAHHKCKSTSSYEYKILIRILFFFPFPFPLVFYFPFFLFHSSILESSSVLGSLQTNVRMLPNTRYSRYVRYVRLRVKTTCHCQRPRRTHRRRRNLVRMFIYCLLGFFFLL